VSLRSRLDKLEQESPPPLSEIYWPNLHARTAADIQPDNSGIPWLDLLSGRCVSKYANDPIEARIAAAEAHAKAIKEAPKPVDPKVTNPTPTEGERQ